MRLFTILYLVATAVNVVMSLKGHNMEAVLAWSASAVFAFCYYDTKLQLITCKRNSTPL